MRHGVETNKRADGETETEKKREAHNSILVVQTETDPQTDRQTDREVESQTVTMKVTV